MFGERHMTMLDNMKTLIKNARVVLPDRIVGGAVLVHGGIISRVITDGEGLPAADEVIDAEGDWLAPGFIDMHTHGAGGSDFMDGTVEAYRRAAVMHARHGTTLLFPTTLTSTNELLFESFETYRKALEEVHEGAAFGGMHLEGPYFSPQQAGAQDPRYLRNPSPEDYLPIMERGEGLLKRWSFAPELDGSEEFASCLKSHGILASIGHTNATFEQCDAAYRSGATHLTHFYSCMSTVTRRNAYRHAGVVEYGYWQDGMTVEIIADGIHVPKSLLNLLVKLKGCDGIALVTDSMRAAGMPEGPSILGGLSDGQEVVVEDGVAKLMDRSAFAGSVATADRLVRTMLDLTDVSLPEAVRMASLVPARIMGLDSAKGSIEPGKDADLVIFGDGIKVKRTIIKGNTTYEA